MARDVGGVHGARRTGRAERPLRERALVVPREDATPVLELVDVAGRLGREDLDRVLVSQVVGALHGVERVLLRAVLGGVAERRVDAAFRGARMTPRGVQFRDDADVRTCVESLDGGTHAGTSSPDHHDVVHEADATWCVPRRQLVERQARTNRARALVAALIGTVHVFFTPRQRRSTKLPALRRRRGQRDGTGWNAAEQRGRHVMPAFELRTAPFPLTATDSGKTRARTRVTAAPGVTPSTHRARTPLQRTSFAPAPRSR